MLCPPLNLFERARWVDANLPALLEGIPLAAARDGWSAVSKLEAQIFPGSSGSDWLHGGILDPTCPACGVETDEGTVARAGDVFHVTYQTCGHVLEMDDADLRARVRHAGHA